MIERQRSLCATGAKVDYICCKLCHESMNEATDRVAHATDTTEGNRKAFWTVNQGRSYAFGSALSSAQRLKKAARLA